ncbi:MAG: hypothetical protein KGY51_11700 [Psychroflexus sp.]|nr:hypothetical protein [Psychroflexus sp.]
MTTLENLQDQIKTLKAGRTLKVLKAEDPKTYYKVKSLASKAGELKAEANGNYITKEHLIEYKGLIIWAIRKTNYNGYLNLKEAMTIVLSKVENEKIVYKTSRSIKSILVDLATRSGLEQVENTLRKSNGISELTNTNENRLLQAFAQHRLNTLM